MTDSACFVQVVGTWVLNARLNLELLDAVPARGLTVVPAGSNGRNIAQVFAHVRTCAAPGCNLTERHWWRGCRASRHGLD